MAPKDIIYNGYKFVPNNYAAILDKDIAPSEFNFVQDFLEHSEIGFALTQPQSISTEQVVRFWSTGYYDDGSQQGTPSIIFTVQDVEYMVTPTTVHRALHLPEDVIFTGAVNEVLLQNMMASLGYEASLAKMGGLGRKHLRKE